VKIRSTFLLAGAAIGACCTTALAAVVVPVYSDNFEAPVTLGQLSPWSFADVHSGIPTLDTQPDSLKLHGIAPPVSPTRFLGEFGGDDSLHLTLPLAPQTQAVRIQFDAYLLRTWDGASVEFAGPDTFGYGIAGRNPVLNNTFSNGEGPQDYCPGLPAGSTCLPTTGSTSKNQLGFEVRLRPPDPVPGGPVRPPVGTPMSLVYHFDSGPLAFTGNQVTFDFFSKNLQLNDPFNPDNLVVLDESWGLDNVNVTAVLVPEPRTWALLLTGLLLLSYATSRRGRLSR
jgi:hypothetical protein